MVTVTDAATRHLAEILSNVDAAEEEAIRFVREGQKITPRFDRERPGDTVYDHEGNTVLLLGEDIVAEIDNKTLDVQDTDEGPRLVLN